ncbi:peptidase C13 family protein, partial [Oesophagostomum dentatum]
KDSVNPENFLNILRGNASGVTGGSGRVIKSKPNDRIFVYFSDHGDIGMLIFPKDLLTVKQLNGTLNWMHQNDRYSQMVFYIEACYIYAVTAANGKQPSYATHCTNGMRLPCLGDEFTASWTEDSDE